MNLVKHCKIHCLSETLSPITHNMKTAGNESVINREQIFTNGKMRDVPVLSGNAIRHRMIREPGAMFIIKQCDLEGKLNIDQANYLLNGGSLSESSVSENLGKISAMQELLPLYRLLGGSLKNQVIGGSLYVLRGVLVCEENRDQLKKQLPEGFDLPEESLRSCEEFISQFQYTRGDARKRPDSAQILEIVDTDEKTGLMIYNGQSVIPGAFFYHGFVLQNISPLEIGALVHAVKQWESAGGTIGGSARIGHGKLKLNLFFEDGEDFYGSEIKYEDLVADYVRHIENNKEKIVDWLNDTFPGKTKKKKEASLL